MNKELMNKCEVIELIENYRIKTNKLNKNDLNLA